MPRQDEQISLFGHAAAAALYLGTAPFFVFSRRRRHNAFIHHHYTQAMGLILLGLFFLSLSVLLVLVISCLMVYYRPLYDAIHPEALLRSLMRKLFIVWATIWLFALLLSLMGSRRPVLLVHWLGTRKRLALAAAISVWMLYAAAAASAILAFQSSRMLRNDGSPGSAYLLYEDNDRFPRWLFALGFRRCAVAAREKWGEDSVLMLKLTDHSLARALREGRFVFVGSHGTAQGLLTKEGFIEPGHVLAMTKNPALQFVYLAGCDSGAQRATWDNAFHPATVVTYDRLTAVLEHIWWLWKRGPEIIRQLD